MSLSPFVSVENMLGCGSKKFLSGSGWLQFFVGFRLGCMLTSMDFCVQPDHAGL